MAHSFDTSFSQNHHESLELQNLDFNRFERYSHTYHSYCRSKQRCIPYAAIDLVLDYGKATPAGRGAESYSFDNRTWRKACDHLGADVRLYEKYRNVYVIVADRCIVTVAWRH